MLVCRLQAAAFRRVGERLGHWAVWSVVEQSAKEIGTEQFGAHETWPAMLCGHHEGSRSRRVCRLLVLGSLHRSGCIPAPVDLDRKADRGNGPKRPQASEQQWDRCLQILTFRRWQVCEGDFSPDAWLLLRTAGACGLTGDPLLRTECEGRNVATPRVANVSYFAKGERLIILISESPFCGES
jgi:hypothetical protein